MRGEDHPLFIPDLFPTIIDNKIVKIKEEIYPVIVYIKTEDGQEHFFKYPKEKFWQFNSNITKVCLTDSLSFDWIIEI